MRRMSIGAVPTRYTIYESVGQVTRHTARAKAAWVMFPMYAVIGGIIPCQI